MNTEKVNGFNLLNEQVKKFTSGWSQSLVNARNTSYLKPKTLDIVYEA